MTCFELNKNRSIERKPMTEENKAKPEAEAPKPKAKPKAAKKSIEKSIVIFGRDKVLKSCGILGFGEEVRAVTPPNAITEESLRNLSSNQKSQVLEHLKSTQG